MSKGTARSNRVYSATLSNNGKNLKRKKEFFILPISKQDVLFLREKGYTKYVLDGNSNRRYHSYFVVESPRVLKELEKYHNAIKVK